ncbi:MAG: CbtA family protein [Alphaproteobacteria bacterium]|nr:CbtA family protein [Alphaproteobacteria bacterium]
MLRRILLTALIAGTIAGLFAAGLQYLKLIPLIAAAEVYEAAGAHEHQHNAGQDDVAPAWEPAPGIERGGYTILADLLAGIGFALLLSGAVALARLRGYAIDARRGLIWGAAGFVVFAVAPAIGLPPELPGMASAELAARQQWWLLTAAATAAGLGIAIFARPLALRLAGVVLLLMPHLLGAPAAPEGGAGVPAELAAEFATASLVIAAAFWLLLGSLSGWLYHRFE